jgi:hypothetical protein
LTSDLLRQQCRKAGGTKLVDTTKIFLSEAAERIILQEFLDAKIGYTCEIISKFNVDDLLTKQLFLGEIKVL